MLLAALRVRQIVTPVQGHAGSPHGAICARSSPRTASGSRRARRRRSCSAYYAGGAPSQPAYRRHGHRGVARGRLALYRLSTGVAARPWQSGRRHRPQPSGSPGTRRETRRLGAARRRGTTASQGDRHTRARRHSRHNAARHTACLGICAGLSGLRGGVGYLLRLAERRHWTCSQGRRGDHWYRRQRQHRPRPSRWQRRQRACRRCRPVWACACQCIWSSLALFFGDAHARLPFFLLPQRVLRHMATPTLQAAASARPPAGVAQRAQALHGRWIAARPVDQLGPSGYRMQASHCHPLAALSPQRQHAQQALAPRLHTTE